MAKSKLPSIQVQYTIPKLELNAMTLAMRLTNSVLDQLHSVVNIQEIYVFSDSEVVLKWLQLKPEKEVGQFVHNRLIEIRKIHNHITEQNRLVRFGYVASHDNPADCGTRGLSRDEFAMHFWWTMQSPPSDWLENNKFFILKTDDTGDELPSLACEQFIEILTISKKSSAEDDSDLFEPGQVRTWTKAKRVLAYALRFLLVAKLNMKRINKIMLFDKGSTHQQTYLNKMINQTLPRQHLEKLTSPTTAMIFVHDGRSTTPKKRRTQNPSHAPIR
ncbi:hypothetical protein Aduo_013077 [Ancylostoma duodenale]